ncbi:MAG: proline dehydrogenase family protein, partial [Rhizobiaceae bacterium]|nr:proline dehydrogenase family protein [Rhizobiaceae bacterium]
MPASNPSLLTLRQQIRDLTNHDETRHVRDLLGQLSLSESERRNISAEAIKTIELIRARHDAGMMETFLSEYGLDTDEGVALMCLAEAYLRTPDSETLDALISDKIGEGDWARHLGRASSSLVNASTWALMLTGRVFRTIPADANDMASLMHSMVQRLGEPVARTAVGEAMKILGRQFVLGRDIEEALSNAKSWVKNGYLHSFDMLGEAARTGADAKRYFLTYSNAISQIAKHANKANAHDNHGLSVKLSALHPRYETINKARIMSELVPKVAALARQAKAANIALAIDAEEADRLDISLDIFENLARDPDLGQWDGLGIVVQAYQKRAPYVLDWLISLGRELSKKSTRKFMVRLVKGAYWDSEIKHAQEMGLADYPVYTRKPTTDLSYQICAERMMRAQDVIYGQ